MGDRWPEVATASVTKVAATDTVNATAASATTQRWMRRSRAQVTGTAG